MEEDAYKLELCLDYRCATGNKAAISYQEYVKHLEILVNSPVVNLTHAFTFFGDLRRCTKQALVCEKMIHNAWKRNPAALADKGNFERFLQYQGMLKADLIKEMVYSGESQLHRYVKKHIGHPHRSHDLHIIFKEISTKSSIILQALLDVHNLDPNGIFFCNLGPAISLIELLMLAYPQSGSSAKLVASCKRFKLPDTPGFFRNFHETHGYLVRLLIPIFTPYIQRMDGNGNSIIGLCLEQAKEVFEPYYKAHIPWKAIVRNRAGDPKRGLKPLEVIARKYHNPAALVDLAKYVAEIPDLAQIFQRECEYGSHLVTLLLSRRNFRMLEVAFKAVAIQELANTCHRHWLICTADSGAWKKAQVLAYLELLQEGYLHFNNRLHRMHTIRFFEIMLKLSWDLRYRMVDRHCGFKSRWMNDFTTKDVYLALLCFKAEYLLLQLRL